MLQHLTGQRQIQQQRRSLWEHSTGNANTPRRPPPPLDTPNPPASPPASNSQRGEGHSWGELLLLADPPSVHLVLVKATARHDKGDCGQLPKRIHAYPVQTVLPMSFDSPRPPRQTVADCWLHPSRTPEAPAPTPDCLPVRPLGLPLQILL